MPWWHGMRANYLCALSINRPCESANGRVCECNANTLTINTELIPPERTQVNNFKFDRFRIESIREPTHTHRIAHRPETKGFANPSKGPRDRNRMQLLVIPKNAEHGFLGTGAGERGGTSSLIEGTRRTEILVLHVSKQSSE